MCVCVRTLSDLLLPLAARGSAFGSDDDEEFESVSQVTGPVSSVTMATGPVSSVTMATGPVSSVTIATLLVR